MWNKLITTEKKIEKQLSNDLKEMIINSKTKEFYRKFHEWNKIKIKIDFEW